MNEIEKQEAKALILLWMDVPATAPVIECTLTNDGWRATGLTFHHGVVSALARDAIAEYLLSKRRSYGLEKATDDDDAVVGYAPYINERQLGYAENTPTRLLALIAAARDVAGKPVSP